MHYQKRTFYLKKSTFLSNTIPHLNCNETKEKETGIKPDKFYDAEISLTCSEQLHWTELYSALSMYRPGCSARRAEGGHCGHGRPVRGHQADGSGGQESGGWKHHRFCCWWVGARERIQHSASVMRILMIVGSERRPFLTDPFARIFRARV